MEPENPLLDEYILAQTPKKKPKVCFIPTASGDSVQYIERFYKAFSKYDCECAHLSLLREPRRDLAPYLLGHDIWYVGGGNTKNLLELWREWGVDQIARQAWEQGIILAGISAGAMCWFEEGITDSYGDRLEPMACLGFLNGSYCPHFDGEADRRPTYERFVRDRVLKPGVGVDDGAAVHYVDGERSRLVCSRKAASVYEVRGGRSVEEGKLAVSYLGSDCT